jgi:Tfp pilus assembly protein PilO
MPDNLPSINFAGNKQESAFDKIMNWTLTVGRLIVILTEIIAVSAFLYRFSLDDQLADLHSSIKEKKQIISNLSKDESKYRNLQNLISLVSNLSTGATKIDQNITDITGLIPSSITNANLSFDSTQMGMGAEISSTSTLKELMDSFSKYNGAESISINNLESKSSTGLSVNITVKLK